MKILSHEDAIKEVKANSKFYNVVFITNPGNPFYCREIYDLVAHAKKILINEFIDIDEFRYDENKTDWDGGPQKSHVEDILKWTENKDNLIICCRMGISRSSATAYVIACRTQSPDEAVKILHKDNHYPNRRIIKLGAEILNKPEMIDIINQYYKWKN